MSNSFNGITSLLDVKGNARYAIPVVGGTAITAFFYAIAGVFNWPFSTPELLAVWTSFICTFLCVYQSRWNYPVGIASTSLLAYVFYQSDLLGSAALNLYLIPTLVYGWFIWGKDKTTRPVGKVKQSDLPIYLSVTAVVYLGAKYLIEHFGGNLGTLDAWLLVGSVFAQFLLDRKRIETWFVWIAVNVVSIYVYFNSELYLLGLQFVAFLINAVWGFHEWNKTMKADQKTMLDQV